MRAIALVLIIASATPAAADATVSLTGSSWEHFGFPKGTPVLAIGEGRLLGGTGREMPIRSSKALVAASVHIQGTDELDRFFFAVRDGHRYHVSPDPCCGLTVSDADADWGRLAVCGKHRDTCPAGTVSVDKFVYRKACGARPTCAPPPLLRVVGDGVTIQWSADPAEPWSTAYKPAPVGRREEPTKAIVRRGSIVVWDESVILHHGNRYTIEVPARGPVRWLIDTP